MLSALFLSLYAPTQTAHKISSFLELVVTLVSIISLPIIPSAINLAVASLLLTYLSVSALLSTKHVSMRIAGD